MQRRRQKNFQGGQRKKQEIQRDHGLLLPAADAHELMRRVSILPNGLSDKINVGSIF